MILFAFFVFFNSDSDPILKSAMTVKTSSDLEQFLQTPIGGGELEIVPDSNLRFVFLNRGFGIINVDVFVFSEDEKELSLLTYLPGEPFKDRGLKADEFHIYIEQSGPDQSSRILAVFPKK